MKATDCIEVHEAAIVLFTRGDRLLIRPDGTGETGDWKVNPERVPGKAIIYDRPQGADQAAIYVANVTGVSSSRRPGRRMLHLSQIRRAGSTDANWLEFAEGSQNPVRYVSK